MDNLKDIQEQMKFDGSETSSDKKTYSRLFKGLEQTPTFELGENFASKVLLKINRIEKKRRIWFLIFTSLGI